MKADTGQALRSRALPEDLRERVASLLFDERFDGAPHLVNWPLDCAARALLEVLTALGASAGLGAPRIILPWGNSD